MEDAVTCWTSLGAQRDHTGPGHPGCERAEGRDAGPGGPAPLRAGRDSLRHVGPTPSSKGSEKYRRDPERVVAGCRRIRYHHGGCSAPPARTRAGPLSTSGPSPAPTGLICRRSSRRGQGDLRARAGRHAVRRATFRAGVKRAHETAARVLGVPRGGAPSRRRQRDPGRVRAGGPPRDAPPRLRRPAARPLTRRHRVRIWPARGAARGLATRPLPGNRRGPVASRPSCADVQQAGLALRAGVRPHRASRLRERRHSMCVLRLHPLVPRGILRVHERHPSSAETGRSARVLLTWTTEFRSSGS